MSQTVRLSAVAVLLAAGAVVLSANTRGDAALPRDLLSGFPLTIDDWRGEDAAPIDRNTMQVLGVDDYVLRSYSQGDAHVGLYVGYYRSQRQGDTIHSPMNCLPGAGWVPVEAGRSTIATAAGPVEVNRYLIQKGEERQVALYWYEGRGRTVASEYWSKAYLVLDAARRNRTDGALVRVLAPVPRGASPAAAQQTAESFAARLLPMLPPYIPR